MTPWALGLRLLLVQGLLQIVLLLLARALGRPLRREVILLGLALPWLVLAPWIQGPRILVPTGSLAGQIPGTMPQPVPDPHLNEQNDVIFQFVPWEMEARHALAAGRLPLWSDLVDGGSSLWANLQAGVLSPIAMLARAFPIQHHLLALLALKIMIAAQGAWVLARLAGARRGGAFVAAFSAGLCGGVMAWAMFAHSAVVAWVPWQAAGVVRLFRRPSRPSRTMIALAAALTAVVLVSGQPEVALAGGVLAAVCGLAFRRRKPGRGDGGAAIPAGPRGFFIRQLGAAALAALLGAGLAAVALVPFAVLLPDTIRAQEHLAPPSAPQAMQLARPATWFQYHKGGYFATPWNPHVHGRPFQETFRGPIGWALAEAPYAGLVALAAALAGFVLRRPALQRRAVRVLVVFCGIVLLLAVGFIPLQNVLHRVPVFRIPEYGRFLPVMSIALAVAGGLGAEALFGRRSRALAAYVLATAILVSLFLLADAHVVGVWALIAGAFCLTLFGWSRRRLARRAAWGLVVAALAFDLVPWARFMLPLGDAALFYPTTPEMAAASKLAFTGGPWRVTGQDFLAYPSTLAVYGLAEPRTHNPMARAEVVRALTAAFGFAPSNDPYFSPLLNLGHPLLDFLNVRVVITNKYLPVPPGMQRDPGLTGMWRVYANPEALPRFFLATGADLIPRAGVQPWIAAMRDPRHVALLEEEAGDLAIPPSDWNPAAVRVLEARPGDVRLGVAALLAALAAATRPPPLMARPSLLATGCSRHRCRTLEVGPPVRPRASCAASP